MDRHELLIKKLEFAVRARDLEISLFWSRATYFWAFLIVLYGGFVLLTINKIYLGQVAALSASAFVSFCWILVVLAGRYWQKLWELRIDILEMNSIGPLFSVREANGFGWRAMAWRTSVSRLALFVSVAAFISTWFLLIVTVRQEPGVDLSAENLGSLLSGWIFGADATFLSDEDKAWIMVAASVVASFFAWVLSRPSKRKTGEKIPRLANPAIYLEPRMPVSLPGK